jgi:hypothetical protein
MISTGPTGGLAQRNAPLAAPSPLTKSYSAYGGAVNQQAGDYDTIMQGYKDYLGRAQQGYSPVTASYNRSPDVTNALGDLSNLTDTGGYSQGDIQNLRERGVSPIRSVYASAQRNIDRQRALNGGYSPNYTAATAKMTRDESSQIADQMSKVNAGIAQNVASNKLQAAPSYGNLAESENALSNNFSLQNMEAQNDALKFKNTGALGALQGMSSLYGTTPALVNTFGNQAMQASNLQNNITQGNTNNRLRQISSIVGGALG